MNKEERQHILLHHKLAFSLWDIIERYFILIAPIGICFVAFSMFIGGIRFGHIYQNNFLNSFFLTAITLLCLGLWLTIFIFKRIESERTFKVINIPNHACESIIEKIIYQLGWTIISKDSTEIVAITKISYFSWGELVTILFEKDQLLINTRARGRQPFTINRDKVNYKKILENLPQ